VILGNLLSDEPLQMALIQRDHVVEQVAAAASDPTYVGTACNNLSAFESCNTTPRSVQGVPFLSFLPFGLAASYG
jgi:hypothetical protein